MRKSSLSIAVLAVLFLSLSGIPASSAVLQGHTHSPLVLQGHSPIVLLVTDPNGFQIGCKAIPCTSTSSSNFVNTIPASEGPATYNFATNKITIQNPTGGVWTVEFIGTGGTSPTPFTITATTCPESNGDSKNKGHTEPGCPPADPDDRPVTVTLLSGTVQDTQTGSATFMLNSDSSISSIVVTPVFPFGSVVAVLTPLVGLAGYAAIARRRSLKESPLP